MSDVYLSALTSALSYLDAPIGRNVSQLILDYVAEENVHSAFSWGNNYNTNYLNNLEIVKVYNTGMSLQAYIFANFNTQEIIVAFRGTQEEIFDNLENACFRNWPRRRTRSADV